MLLCRAKHVGFKQKCFFICGDVRKKPVKSPQLRQTSLNMAAPFTSVTPSEYKPMLFPDEYTAQDRFLYHQIHPVAAHCGAVYM